METLIILCSIISIIGCFFIFKFFANKKIKKYKEEIFTKDEIDFKKKLKEKYQSLENDLQGNISALTKQIEEKIKLNNDLLNSKEQELSIIMNAKKEALQEKINNEISDWAKSAQEAANFSYELKKSTLVKEMQQSQETLSSLNAEIENYKAKRDTINQEIIRSRLIEEKESFYRIQLSEESRKDINLINTIRNQFSKIDLLDKLIYDCYIKKPVDEMIKRVLNGRAPCGIYKITRLKTKEIYIGQSTDIKARFKQHTKSCYHCGTISHSQLHTIMEQDGIENFTWELLEEVEKPKLREREAYWIEFYDTKKYGLNERLG